jgi:hypothetical protein
MNRSCEFGLLFKMSRAAVVLHHQRSPEDLQQLLAWYKIRDTRLGQNDIDQDMNTALELASVCEHPNAIWLTKLFGGRDVTSREEARQVFLGCENDPRALCFSCLLGGTSDEVLRAADLGDAFAQAWVTVWTSVFDGREILENVMVSTALVISTKVEPDVSEMWKQQKRIFWLPLR